MKKYVIKNKNVWFCSVCIIIFCAFILGLSNCCATSFAYAASDNTQKLETKIYSNATLDEDFDDSSVLVVMDKNVGGINKEFGKSFFGDISLKSIEDLSSISGDVEKKEYLNKKEFRQIFKLNLTDKSKENVLVAIKELEKIDGILWAGPNHYDHSAVVPTAASGTRYPDLWGMHDTCGIQAEQAWDMTVGVRNNVRVGIIDSGIATHVDLDANVVEGWDFSNDNATTNDDVIGHGTHVAGTIGATGANTDGVVGVSWNVQLVPLQVTNESGSWPIATVTKAIRWAIDNNIDIINYSGGGTSNNLARRTAIGNFSGLFVCAAGNNNSDNDSTKYYPSDYSQDRTFSGRVISVGAINQAGNRASFSNYGNTTVSIFAPGVNILSTVPTTIDASGYQSWDGTSMATPHVTGTAALMFTYYSHMFDGLTRSEMAANIKSAIIQSAVVDAGAPVSGLCVAGARLNALNSLCKITFNTTNLSSTTLRIDSLKHGFWGYFPIPSEMYGHSVTQIGDWAFNNQGNISQIDIPSTVTSIGANAFQNCSYMTDIEFESGSTLNTIGNAAFYNCGSLESITIPGGVTSIGPNTFQNCYALSSVNFLSNSTLTNIGNSAFYACASLSKITIPTSLSTIGFNAFQGCVALSKVSFYSGSQLSRIENAAFYNCSALTNICLPSNLTYIGYDAFSACSTLDSVTLSNNTISICGNAFADCSNLTIYTSMTSAPSGWQTNWNLSARPVAWGCSVAGELCYVASLTKTLFNPSNINAINSIKNPYRDGYSFGGWYTASDYSGTQYMDLATAPNGVLYAKWNKNSCVAEGTLITIADGSQVAVEDLIGNEDLLVWNMLTGQFDTAPILFVDSDPYTEYEITHLYFSDGTEVKVIDEHGFWDFDLNEYVFLRNDAEQYIGHWFNKQTEDVNGNMIWTAVQLIDVDVYDEYTTAWSPVTYGHLCYYVNGMLSMPGATEGFLNIFDVNPTTMAYDTVAMAEDIATYGLYAYEEFAELIPIPEEIFNAFNGQYLKVSIGKGLIDMDGIAALVERYAPFFQSEEENLVSDNEIDEEHHNNGNHYDWSNGNQYGHSNGNNGKGANRNGR